MPSDRSPNKVFNKNAASNDLFNRKKGLPQYFRFATAPFFIGAGGAFPQE
jgi:hypothetical protein